MNILDKIIEQKKIEVAHAKAQRSIAELETTKNFKLPVRSLAASLLKKDSTGTIKRIY